jgi:hypothetical protein
LSESEKLSKFVGFAQGLTKGVLCHAIRHAQWRDDGTWQRIMDTLRAEVRTVAGREATLAVTAPSIMPTEGPLSDPPLG